MKTKTKLLLISSVSTLLLLTLTSFQTIRYPLLSFSIVTLGVAVCSYLLLRHFIAGRLETFTQSLKEQVNGDLSDVRPIPVSGRDEVTEISKEVNYLLESIRASSLDLEQKVAQRTQELQSHNEQLREDLAKSRFQQKRYPDDIECLKKIARHDNISALPNRLFFNEILNKSISHAARRNKILAVLAISLDNFDYVTTTIGKVKSDIVINEISKRFSNVLRTEDILAKVDGDDFTILLNDIGKPKFASTVAEKVLQVCSHPIKIDDHDFKITCSIGISIFPNDGRSLEGILKSADDALFKVKQAGGASYQFSTHEMHVEAREYIQIESALRNAITNNELTLYYQPKVHLKRGTMAGLEALIRWEHPVLGIVNPDRFIPLAEETGLIMKLGEWALREACLMNKHWQDEGYEHLTVAVNLSPKQFFHPELVNMISNVLEKTQLNAKYLEIEIMEKTIMDNVEVALKTLADIKALGVQISMDHFGTGYTSISYLKQLPLSSVKIDRTYIGGIPNSPDDSAIASALIALVHNLGIEVVAEGVETAEQVEFLSVHHCDMVQGYFLSHPLPAAKVMKQFKKLQDEVML